ncbi:MAG: hypothetical protein H7A43_07300 [Verrucomicrobia bacterium]|nr:hypothetical protein [Verrucomicrobiota bacterium]
MHWWHRGGMLALWAWLLSIESASGATLYVWTNSPAPNPPYDCWSNAAHDIQSAIDISSDHDLILVTNGLYQSGGRVVVGTTINRIAITNAITVQSVQGPEWTIISGWNEQSIRCAYLGSNAQLVGFTLNSGVLYDGNLDEDYQGAGAWCEPSATLSNCWIHYNGILILGYYESAGGGVYGGNLQNCRVWSNYIFGGISTYSSLGGGAYGVHAEQCQFTENEAPYASGGGVAASDLILCSLINNRAAIGGGAYDSTLNRCQIISNAAPNLALENVCIGPYNCCPADQGGGVADCIVSNSVLAYNSSKFGGGAYAGTVVNSTLIGNRAIYGGGATWSTLIHTTVQGNDAQFGGGVYNATSINSIIYDNSAARGSNYLRGDLSFCCTVPHPGGNNNITNHPRLLDDRHLATDSPCRGMGDPSFTMGTDIDGEVWGSLPSIGCDEPLNVSGSNNLQCSIRTHSLPVSTGYPVTVQADVQGQPTSLIWRIDSEIAAVNRRVLQHVFESTGNHEISLQAYSQSHPEGVTTSLTLSVMNRQILYVARSGTNATPPYSSWMTAATNLQPAIDSITQAGSLIMVSNGIYVQTQTLVIDHPVHLYGVNGPEETIIQATATSHFNLVRLGTNTVLQGFTICGAGEHAVNSQFSSLVTDCTIISNSAEYCGAGVRFGTVTDSKIAYNRALEGGGVQGCYVKNSQLFGNTARNDNYGGLGYGSAALYSELVQCLIYSNLHAGSAVHASQFENGNILYNQSHGAWGGQTINSILYGNTWDPTYLWGDFKYCRVPAPISGKTEYCITNDPHFVSETDFHLSPDSPCRDTGNNLNTEVALDLDGAPRIVHHAVDMGAYEYQGPEPADSDGDHIPNWWEVQQDLTQVRQLRG